ncbi:hypothetical protein CPB85DRAFT_624291 [Mucidula mucida]|nr:hypothetical protein CPB85DRAFT_624291 [Mucidula mucida]
MSPRLQYRRPWAVPEFLRMIYLRSQVLPKLMLFSRTRASKLQGILPRPYVSLLTPASQIERPTSPWTPSYSVTSQGPGLTAEEDISDTEIDDAKDLKDIPVVSVTPGEESGDILSDPLVSEVERPKSPWTPSYSVSVQGSPMQPTAELESSEITENVDDVSRLADSEALLTADVFVTQQDIAPLDIVNAV